MTRECAGAEHVFSFVQRLPDLCQHIAILTMIEHERGLIADGILASVRSRDCERRRLRAIAVDQDDAAADVLEADVVLAGRKLLSSDHEGEWNVGDELCGLRVATRSRCEKFAGRAILWA